MVRNSVGAGGDAGWRVGPFDYASGEAKVGVKGAGKSARPNGGVFSLRVLAGIYSWRWITGGPAEPLAGRNGAYIHSFP